jgi:hypothetical protein
VLRDGVLYEVYFPKLPHCEFITDQIKNDFDKQVNRISVNSKVLHLSANAKEVIDLMNFEYQY